MHKGTHHSSQACCFGNRSQKGASIQQVKVQRVTLEWCVGGEKSARKNCVINFSQRGLHIAAKLEIQIQVSSEEGTAFMNTSLGITKLAWSVHVTCMINSKFIQLYTPYNVERGCE